MIELGYYPEPDGNIVFFASIHYKEVKQLLIATWFEHQPLQYETNHTLQSWSTTVEPTEYIEVLFYTGHSRGHRATFYRNKEGEFHHISTNGDIRVHLCLS